MVQVQLSWKDYVMHRPETTGREEKGKREREGREGGRGKERRGEERLSLIHSFSLAKIQKNVSEAVLGHRSVLAIN